MGIQTCVILGCGDVGRRIVSELMLPSQGQLGPVEAKSILACARSKQTTEANALLGVNAISLDIDSAKSLPGELQSSNLIYLVPPPKIGVTDSRSQRVLELLGEQNLTPRRVTLISTTGVYGDCHGEWVTEESQTQPQTERGRRRLDSEQQWLAWCKDNEVAINVLRVPGIYARSRIPYQRIENRSPVVRAEECGFTNRIHADDLAMIAVSVMANSLSGEIFNVTDGRPGKITEYLQAACEVLDLPPLPEISMCEARGMLSSGMLSYLSESRKISNRKMISKLEVTLAYPDFRVGLRH